MDLLTEGEGERGRGPKCALAEDERGLTVERVRRNLSGVPKYFRFSSAMDTNLGLMAKLVGTRRLSIWTVCSFVI